MPPSRTIIVQPGFSHGSETPLYSDHDPHKPMPVQRRVKLHSRDRETLRLLLVVELAQTSGEMAPAIQTGPNNLRHEKPHLEKRATSRPAGVVLIG